MSRSLHLVKRQNGAVISAHPLLRGNDGENEHNPVIEFGALVILSMLLRHTSIKDRDRQLQWDSGAFRKTRMNYDIWTDILRWLLSANASRLITESQRSLSEQEQLEELVFLLYRTESNAKLRIAGTLFSKNYQAQFEIVTLLHAALNADLDTIKTMLENKSPDHIKAMLSVVGTATIDHLGIKRTGTALQMAIYGDDDDMVAYFKMTMDFDAFESQWKAVLKNALSIAGRNKEAKELDAEKSSLLVYHHAMAEAQKVDADRLCAGLENAFKNAGSEAFTIGSFALTANTTSAPIETIVTDFILRLSEYTNQHPMQNRFILENIYKIYRYLPRRAPFHLPCFKRDAYFSQKIFNVVYKVSSARWLQHYASTYGKERNFCLDYLYYDVPKETDVRLHLDLCSTGSDECRSGNIIKQGAIGYLRCKYHEWNWDMRWAHDIHWFYRYADPIQLVRDPSARKSLVEVKSDSLEQLTQHPPSESGCTCAMM